MCACLRAYVRVRACVWGGVIDGAETSVLAGEKQWPITVPHLSHPPIAAGEKAEHSVRLVPPHLP